MIVLFYLLTIAAVALIPLRKTALVLLAVSIAQQVLLVTTDAQNSLAVGGHARIDDKHRKDDFFCDLVLEYAGPLFFTGKVGPLLRQMTAIEIEEMQADLETEEPDEARRRAQLEARRTELNAAIERGDRDPFLLAAIRGPVSVNPLSVYEGLLGYGIFAMEAEPSQWASFNIGELAFPRSRWSLVPLLLVASTLLTLAIVQAKRLDENPAAAA